MFTFKIIKSNAGFRVQFVHKNKQVIFWTENYKGKPSAKKAIQNMVEHAAKATIVEEVEEVASKAKAKTKAPAPAKKAAKKK